MKIVKILSTICILIMLNGFIERTDSFLLQLRGFALFGNDVMGYMKGDVPFGALFVGSQKYKLNKILDHISGLTDQLEQMNIAINSKLDNIMKALMTTMPIRDDLKAGMSEFHTYIVRIDGLWAYYGKYAHDPDSFNQYTIEKFIDATTSLKEGDLPNVLNRMHRLFVPNTPGVSKKSVFDLMIEFRNMSSPLTICEQSSASYQYRIYQIYKLIALSEIRGFLMTVFSYGVLSTYKDAIFENELKTAEAMLVLRAKSYLEKAQDVMSQASDEIILCGTEEHERGKTFAEFERFCQAYASNEYELTNGATCYYECSDMPQSQTRQCLKNEYGEENCVNKIPCKGTIRNCGWVGKGTICHLPDDPIRRYQYLDMKDTFFGQRESCQGVEQWVYPEILRFCSCDICLCMCYEDGPESDSLRTWSLRPQIADISNNKVIIGMKFVQKDGVMHVQAAQGVLGKFGVIERKGVAAIPLETFTLNSGRQWTATGTNQVNNETIELVADVDYMEMLNNDKRWVNADDIYLEKGYVITGVRLQKTMVVNDVHIGLELYATKFNFTDGKLSTDEGDSYWVTSANMRKKSEYYNSDRTGFRKGRDEGGDPEKSTDNYPDSHPNQWIAIISATSWRNGGGQTIPYVDIRSVIPAPRFGLGGAGIYHKGDDPTGGYIAFKVMHLDLALYIDPVLSEEDMAKYRKQSENQETQSNDEEELIDEDTDELDTF